jgi:hypothetical protein
MNLLNLILLILIFIYYISNNFTWGVQILQGVHHNDDYSLVFIKPENLSKTELIEKFKELSSSKSLNELKDKKNEDKISIKDLFKSYYSKIISFSLKFKWILTKIALLLEAYLLMPELKNICEALAISNGCYPFNYKKQRSKLEKLIVKMNLLLIIMVVIYFQGGQYLFTFISCILMIIICNFILLFNPFSFLLKMFKIISLIIIFIIIFINLNYFYYLIWWV